MSKLRGHLRAGFLAIVVVLGPLSQVSPAQGDDQPMRGIVWAVPSSFPELRAELEDLADHGAEAVRVGLVLDPSAYVLSQMHGIRLFQEVDLAYYPASRMAARVDEISAEIDSALAVAATTPVEIFIGLGYWNDTSSEDACDVLAQLTRVVKKAGPSAKTYYITPFIENDRCADVVDFVLLDVRLSQNPELLIERWRAAHDTPVGIAALGASVHPGAGSGFLVPRSPESQARYLERTLGDLVDDQNLIALFVDRWAERDPERLRSVDIDGDYGIMDPDGSARPAAAVVKGFFTGGQRVFAFSAGNAPTEDYSWINLMAFIAAVLFGFTYYGSLGLQSVLRRYFLSHSFYLEKVGDARETTTGMTLFLLFCFSLAASIVGTTLVTHLETTNLWIAITEWSPRWVSLSLRAGATYPGFLVIAFSVLFAGVSLLWAVVLSVVTRGTKGLKLNQTLLIVVLPRWPVALIGLLSLVVLNWHIDAPGIVIVGLTGSWLTVVMIYTGRMFSDYLRLLGITAMWTIPVLVLALGLAAGTGWLMVSTQDLMPEISFLWNLATLAG